MNGFDQPRGTEQNVERARRIEDHLRLSTLPVGIKFYRELSDMPEELGEKPDYSGTFCQFISQSRFERCQIRKNFRLTRETISCPFSPGILGFEAWTGHIATGEHMGGVHFEDAAAARLSQKDIPRLEPFSIEAVLVGPLMDFEVEPDVISFAIVPGMSNKVLDGQMWRTGKPKEMVYYNVCGICGAGVAQAYNQKDLFISFPCHGGRRIGMFTDTELFVALHTKFFEEWILGMGKSYVTGHSFPVGHMLRPNPPLPPHFKIVKWPDKIVPLSQWQEEQRKKEDR